jgi:hypothetical protein
MSQPGMSSQGQPLSQTQQVYGSAGPMYPGRPMHMGGGMNLCIDGFPHDYQKDFTLCGMCWLFWCFPCGIYCCWNDANLKCTKCQAVLQS